MTFTYYQLLFVHRSSGAGVRAPVAGIGTTTRPRVLGGIEFGEGGGGIDEIRRPGRGHPGVAGAPLETQRGRVCASARAWTSIRSLREVVESARALTGAGCSGITTMDASGHLQDFVTAGVSPEDYQRFLHLPHGPDLWEYLRQVPQPLRLRDLAAHLGPLGVSGLTRRWRGASWGRRSATWACRWATSIWPTRRAGRRSPGRTRRCWHRSPRRPGRRSPMPASTGTSNGRGRDLEVLIETSPVGVVVFDARSGQVVSLNRESRRIVGDLGTPGCSAAELLEGLRVRQADGREIVLEESVLRQMLARGGDGSRRGDRSGVPRRPGG